MNFAIVLDKKSSEPLQRQLYEAWRDGILEGRFRPGDRVPSTRDMAAGLGVSRSTVSNAWEQLVAEGYFESAHGSGTFVCRELPENLVAPQGRPGNRPSPQARVKLSRYATGLTEDYVRQPSTPDVIHFPPSIPDRQRFPFALWRKLLIRHLTDSNEAVFEYAEDPAGDPRLRSEIAAYLARMRAVQCTPEQIIVVSGSQQALDLCARVLVEPGQSVAIENPGYLGARRIFAANGARLRPVSIDADGIAIRELKGTAQLVYTTPSHQFPTGISMSLARRLELIQWAHDQSAVIIEDDYSSEYRYSGAPLPSLQGLAGGVPVIYIGTFSKVMFPGLRIGYLVAPPSLAAPLRRAKWLTDRQTPVLGQLAVADFLSEGHLDRHIRRMRRLYGMRRQALIEALDRHFGEHVRVYGDAAGMHAMVRFQDGKLVERAARNRVQLASADPYYLTDPPGREFLFGFAAVGERTIREGVKRLAE